MSGQTVTIKIKCGKSEVEYRYYIKDYDVIDSAKQLINTCGDLEERRLRTDEATIETTQKTQ